MVEKKNQFRKSFTKEKKSPISLKDRGKKPANSFKVMWNNANSVIRL